ncbi:hypothetical protein PIB30_016501 [Stylosanthes scabra]|uniref:Uncharacterized protein n=1 Tax=Stylosanthes scabra TaxID=79078 RepID=A0ABU6Z5W6_9FABA|nr:hypothetical protein [Stylosanthes scabra]
MAAKPDFSSKHIIIPSSPTPNHLREFKISLLDQLAPPLYIPIVLFYSAYDFNPSDLDFKTISEKLKSSLSKVLSIYHPFCGRVKDNSTVECDDSGILFIESKVTTDLSHILNNPQVHEITQLLPFDPYNPQLADQENKELRATNMAVQLNEFTCGGIAIAACFSHKIADGATTATFLKSWAEIASGRGNIAASSSEIDAAMVFPPKDIKLDITRGMVGLGKTEIVTKRFIFDKANLSKLKDQFGSFNPTRVEAVTALIWKSALEAKRVNSSSGLHSASMMSHAVNIRDRMNPPLSKNMLGNFWQQSISPIMEFNGEVRLLDLANMVRETIRKVDADFICKLQGDGFVKIIESLMEAKRMVAQKGIPGYGFSSWVRFGFYEADFGWGMPSWVCTIGVPIENVIILMATRDGDGIEAWVTLNKLDMVEFECNPELLKFTLK